MLAGKTHELVLLEGQRRREKTFDDISSGRPFRFSPDVRANDNFRCRQSCFSASAGGSRVMKKLFFFVTDAVAIKLGVVAPGKFLAVASTINIFR